ncbi:MAG: ABC transporter substrate-binding protein [Ilumatobacter sp.]|uniref:ABC transporter substrate-binding protein n=1 Tax=Ilumatobacter sp. TaxID=1967498 RepID=UPI00391A2B38
MRRPRFRRVFALLAATSLIVAACGGDDDESGAEPVASDDASSDDGAGGSSDAASGNGSSDDGSSEDDRYGGTLTIGHPYLTDTLDFASATALQHEIVLDGIYESLLEVTPEIEFVPHLAESFEQVSETEYLFTIREGVVFHDGTPMTVDDVVYTFESITAEDFAGPAKQRLAPLVSVEAVDDQTVRFELSEPYAPFLYHMASPETTGIRNQAFQEANADNLALVANGTGAFKLRTFVPNELIELERHDEYWIEGLPYLDEVLIPTITDNATRLAGLRTGELDLTEIDPPTLPDLQALDDVVVSSIAPAQTQVIFMNCTRPPLDDVRVRQALFLSIDEQLIMDVLFEPGIATPTRFAPPIAGEYGYQGDGSDLPFFGVDIARAQALLEEAGYPDGIEIEMGFLNTGAFELNRQMIELIRETAAPAGITVNVFAMERGQMIEGEWDAWNTPLPGKPDPAAQDRWLREENALIRCPAPQLEELLDVQNGMTDPADRLGAWEEVESYVEDNAILHNTLAMPNRIRAWQDNVENYVDPPHGRRMFLRQTWLDE